jgi:hypothetical protein
VRPNLGVVRLLVPLDGSYSGRGYSLHRKFRFLFDSLKRIAMARDDSDTTLFINVLMRCEVICCHLGVDLGLFTIVAAPDISISFF